MSDNCPRHPPDSTRRTLREWKLVPLLIFMTVSTVYSVQPSATPAPSHCFARLLVTLTPDVPNPKAPSFLDSLSADPLFQLTWERATQNSVILDLTGPLPEYRCRDEIRRIRRDGRIVWLTVLPRH